MVLKTAEILSFWSTEVNGCSLLLVSYSPSLDVNYAFVTERAYSHSGRHEMNLDDEGFTEMSDCVWEKLRMGGGLKECSVLCLITPLCVTRIHTLRLLSQQPQHVVRHSVQIYVCHRGVFTVWAAECRCVRIYCFAFRDCENHMIMYFHLAACHLSDKFLTGNRARIARAYVRWQNCM